MKQYKYFRDLQFKWYLCWF